MYVYIYMQKNCKRVSTKQKVNRNQNDVKLSLEINAEVTLNVAV